MANIWQGEFPVPKQLRGGFELTAPVGSFPSNGCGFHDMAGNVWQWTTDLYQEHGRIDSPCCTADNPRGGPREASFDERADIRIPRKVTKGGSHLCAQNYCRRYRPAARMAQPIDTSIASRISPDRSPAELRNSAILARFWCLILPVAHLTLRHLIAPTHLLGVLVRTLLRLSLVDGSLHLRILPPEQCFRSAGSAPVLGKPAAGRIRQNGRPQNAHCRRARVSLLRRDPRHLSHAASTCGPCREPLRVSAIFSPKP